MNLATRMEQYAEPMRIALCEQTYELLEDDFVCSPKGEFEVKGFGVMRLYELNGEVHRSR